MRRPPRTGGPCCRLCHALLGEVDLTPWQDGTETISTQKSEPGALDEVDEMILASFKAKVLPRLVPGARTEGIILRRVLRWSAGKSGKSLRGQECETEFDTKFPSHWSWASRCVGATDSCGGHGVPQRHGDFYVSRTRQVRAAVCDKGARSRHADAKQVVDAEGTRGAVLRVPG